MVGRKGGEGFVEQSDGEGVRRELRGGVGIVGNREGPPGPEAEARRVRRVRGGGTDMRLKRVEEGTTGGGGPQGKRDERGGERRGEKEGEVMGRPRAKKGRVLAEVGVHSNMREE